MPKLTKTQIADKIAQYSALQDSIKSLQAEANDLKDELKETLDLGEYEVNSGKELYLVTFVASSNQSIDKARLTSEMGVEFVLKFTKTTAFSKLTVKQIA